jgi:polyisoprenoid-binding protein YceI
VAPGKKDSMLDPHLHPTITVASGRYRIDPDRSQVRYAGRHMFGLGTVHATFSIREGDLSIGDATSPLIARATVDAASFSSANTKRDRDVRSAGLLDVEHYPDITFSSEDMQEIPGEGWLVAGTVTAHGRSVPVDVQVDRVTADGSEVLVHGWARHLDRTTFGITGSRGMVGRYLDLELDVVATPA